MIQITRKFVAMTNKEYAVKVNYSYTKLSELRSTCGNLVGCSPLMRCGLAGLSLREFMDASVVCITCLENPAQLSNGTYLLKEET